MKLLLAALLLAIAQSVSAASCSGFDDVSDTDPFCVYVDWMKNRGVTLGCAPGLYCPNDTVTRMQMAAFMARLGDLITSTLQQVRATGQTADGRLDCSIPVEPAPYARAMRYTVSIQVQDAVGDFSATLHTQAHDVATSATWSGQPTLHIPMQGVATIPPNEAPVVGLRLNLGDDGDIRYECDMMIEVQRLA